MTKWLKCSVVDKNAQSLLNQNFVWGIMNRTSHIVGHKMIFAAF